MPHINISNDITILYNLLNPILSNKKPHMGKQNKFVVFHNKELYHKNSSECPFKKPKFFMLDNSIIPNFILKKNINVNCKKG